MVMNSRVVLILVCLAGTFQSAATASNLGPIGRYLKQTRFQSGYQATEICERRLTASAPAFRKKGIREQIFELHVQTHDAVVAIFEENRPLPFAGPALQAFAVRLRIIGETPAKQLKPYSGELLAMAYEAGALTHMAHRYESLTLQNFSPFFEKVLDIAEPQNAMDRALAATAAAGLANIRSTLIQRSKDPAVRLRGTLEVLAKASAWSDHSVDTVYPLLNAGLLATVKAVEAYPRVAKEQRAVFVSMTEALFAGTEIMLKQMSGRGEPMVENSLGILMRLYDSPDRRAFTKVDQALEEWARLLGISRGGPDGSDALN